MDSTRAHITELSFKRIRAKNCTAAVIPGWMTKILQPLDIAVNRSFKAIVRRLWELWMTEGDNSYTATGRMRRASFSEVAKWVRDAWCAVSEATVTAGFRKAGLLASAPGQPELDESSGSSDSEEEAEEAPATLPPELSELFGSASKDGFEGFQE